MLTLAPLVLGLIGGLIPGPILTAIFTEILQHSLFKSFRIIFIGLITETIVALISLLVLQQLNPPEIIFKSLSLIGAAILVWIASKIYRIKTLDNGGQAHFSTGTVIAMILANGVLWTYWITVCIPKAIEMGTVMVFGQYIFLALVEIGWLLSTIGVAFIFSRFRGILSSPRVVPIIFKVFALTFIYFAASMVWDSAMFFID